MTRRDLLRRVLLVPIIARAGWQSDVLSWYRPRGAQIRFMGRPVKTEMYLPEMNVLYVADPRRFGYLTGITA